MNFNRKFILENKRELINDTFVEKAPNRILTKKYIKEQLDDPNTNLPPLNFTVFDQDVFATWIYHDAEIRIDDELAAEQVFLKHNLRSKYQLV
jgi:hypothetical protein